jgi:hypothetical protein
MYKILDKLQTKCSGYIFFRILLGQKVLNFEFLTDGRLGFSSIERE